MIPPKEKAEQLFREAYMRWCYDISNEKNVATAKNIVDYICNEMVKEHRTPPLPRDTTLQDNRIEYWRKVKKINEKLK